MDLDTEKLFPAHLRDTLRSAGLHKIAGAMLGIDEVTLKEAVAVIGAKAYLRRCETKKVAAGIDALATLLGDKTANVTGSVGGSLLRAGLPSALGGAGIAMVPQLMSKDPVSVGDLVSSGVLGGTLGLAGGAAGAGMRASKANPEAAAEVMHAIRSAS